MVVPPLFLRELRGEVRENVTHLKMPVAHRTICALNRPAVIQNLRPIKCYADPHSSRRTGSRSAASVLSIPIV